MNLKLFACCASLAVAALQTSAAQAAVVVNIAETGGGVTATTSGTLDLTGLMLDFSGGDAGARINPIIAGFITSGSRGDLDVYSGLTGPTSFGEGTGTEGGQGTGDAFGISGGEGQLGVPLGYVSNTPIAATTFFAGQTLQSLGASAGTYVFRTPADTITFNIGASLAPAVPEPGTWTLMLMGFGGVGVAMRRRRRTGGALLAA